MRRLAFVLLATALALPTALAADGGGAAGFQQNDSTDPEQGTAGQAFEVDCREISCTFDARDVTLENATIESYEWDFGDGETGEGPLVNHTFADPGTYEVTLSLTTEDGETRNRTQPVEVTADRPDQGKVPWGGLALGAGALIGSLLLARLT